MRRIPAWEPVASAVALLLTFSNQAAAGTAVALMNTTGDPGVSQQAASMWSHGGTIYIARGARLVGPGDRTIGSIAAVACRRSSTAGNVCIGSSVNKLMRTEAFEFDAGLSAAALRIGWEGVRSRIAWTGEGAPEASGGSNSNGASVSRVADAKGRFFGTHLGSSNDPIEAVVSEGAAGPSGSDPPPRRYTGPTTAAMSPWGFELISNTNDCIDYTAAEKAMARKINAARADKGQRKLRLDTELGRAARKHSNEMAADDLLFHTTPGQLSKRISRWRVLGENVGVGETVPTLHEAFMDSTVHRENILHATYRHVGVGIVHSGGKMWVTVIFENRKDPGTSLPCD